MEQVASGLKGTQASLGVDSQHLVPSGPGVGTGTSERNLTTETRSCQDRAKAEARTKGSWIPEGTTDADLSWGVISGARRIKLGL